MPTHNASAFFFSSSFLFIVIGSVDVLYLDLYIVLYIELFEQETSLAFVRRLMRILNKH